MKMTNFVILLVCALSIISCRTNLEQDGSQLDPIILYAKIANNPTLPGTNSVQYLEIELDPNGLLPDFILVQGKPLFDNGEGYDLRAGDNIYSSVDPVTFPDSSMTGRIDGSEWYLTCSIDASLKGGDCGGSTCPDKSYWGYDTWFCVCLKDCTFCVGDCK